MVALPETEGQEEANMELNYRVIGGTLNQRAEPSMDGRWLQSISNGTRVHGEKSADPAWLLVDYNGKSGYCKAAFLEALQAEPEADPGSEPGESVTIHRTELAALRKALEDVCGRIDQILTE